MSSWKGRRHEIGECSFILCTYLERRQYVHPDYPQTIPDDADILTNGGGSKVR